MRLIIVFMLAIAVVLFFHRLLFLLLCFPFVRLIYRNHSVIQDTLNRSFRARIIRFSYYHTKDLIEDLFLKWIGEIHSHTIRKFFYVKMYCMDIAPKVVIYYGAEIRNPGGITIEDGTIIGDSAVLDGRAGIHIGCNVNFSSNVSIWTLQHDYRDPYFNCTPDHYGPVVIKDRAWLGPNTIILHSVTIGEGAVVAAGAVVTKDVPPYCLVAGIPARVIGKRPESLLYDFNGNHRHFL